MDRPSADRARRTAAKGTVLAVLATAIGTGLYLVRLLRELSSERRRSDTILASIPDGVIVTDTAGRIVKVNPAMEKLSGHSLDEVRDEMAVEVYWGSDDRVVGRPGEVEDVRTALANGEVASNGDAPHNIRTRQGRMVPVAWTAAMIVDDAGAPKGVVTVVRDVTREREADQLKATLVSTASHELRTPLTMIQGFAELLLMRELPETRRKEAAGQILKSAERLSLVIDDLLDVARIESGRLTVEVAAVDAADAIAKVISGFSEGERSRVHVLIEDEVSPLLADEDRLVQILIQLISNAIKYSDDGSPLQISVCSDGPVVELSVRDEGIGLAPEERAQVFDKFYRVDSLDTRDSTGTGLGLYITKSLVEMQGGQIRVESEPGKGSTFYVSFPAALVPATAAPAGSVVS